MSIIKKYNSFIKERQELVGGKSDNMSLEDIAKKHNVSIDEIKSQLEKGLKIEKEHTKDVSKCKEIAMDHLSEDPNYYDRLEKMEKDAEDAIVIPDWNKY